MTRLNEAEDSLSKEDFLAEDVEQLRKGRESLSEYRASFNEQFGQGTLNSRFANLRKSPRKIKAVSNEQPQVPQNHVRSRPQRVAAQAVPNYYNVDWKAGGTVRQSSLDGGAGSSDSTCCVCFCRGRRFPTKDCEVCDRSFHAACVDKPTGRCPVCTADSNKKLVPSIKILVSRATRSPAVYRGFTPLLDRVSELVPTNFELPDWLLDEFEGLFKHPETGAYMDTTEYAVYLGPPTKSPTFKECLPLCYRCGRSEGFPWTSNLVLCKDLDDRNLPNPFSSGTPAFRVRAERSDLIQCDFCGLWWHLDCLDPPLAFRPHSLLSGSFQAERHGANLSKGTRFGARDPVTAKAKLSNLEKLIKKFHRGPEPAPRTFSWRKKWQCPCHEDSKDGDSLRHRSRKFANWKWIKVQRDDADAALRVNSKQCNLGAADSSLVPAKRSESKVESRVTSRTLSSKNDGEISVQILDDEMPDEEFIWPPHEARLEAQMLIDEARKHSARLLVPERVIKSDFFAKVRSTNAEKKVAKAADYPVGLDVAEYLHSLAQFAVAAHDIWVQERWLLNSSDGYKTLESLAERSESANASNILYQMRREPELRKKLNHYENFLTENPDIQHQFAAYLRKRESYHAVADT